MTWTTLLFLVAAFVIGYGKTSIGGVATIAVAIFASIMPAKESTGAVLAPLIVGDLIAIYHYRRECDWAIVRALLPTVVPGLVLGAVFLRIVDDTTLRRSIGGIIIAMVLIQLVMMRGSRTPSAVSSAEPAAEPAAESQQASHKGGISLAAGLGAGFTTMTANAAGSVMTLYLVAKGVDKRRFVGTTAWFFFGVNLCKVPFSVGLGLLDWPDALRALALAPAVAFGAWAGLHTVRVISQRVFELVVLIASAGSAAALIIH